MIKTLRDIITTCRRSRGISKNFALVIPYHLPRLIDQSDKMKRQWAKNWGVTQELHCVVIIPKPGLKRLLGFKPKPIKTQIDGRVQTFQLNHPALLEWYCFPHPYPKQDPHTGKIIK